MKLKSVVMQLNNRQRNDCSILVINKISRDLINVIWNGVPEIVWEAVVVQTKIAIINAGKL